MEVGEGEHHQEEVGEEAGLPLVEGEAGVDQLRVEGVEEEVRPPGVEEAGVVQPREEGEGAAGQHRRGHRCFDSLGSVCGVRHQRT